MGFREKALNTGSKILRGGIQLVGGKQAASIRARLSEDLSPIIEQTTPYGSLKFFSPGKMPEFRARTLMTKEPETLEWIQSFNSNDIVWDIGANVGAYSLFAALKGHKVLSFEPSPGNYYLLSRNIELNRLDEKISGYCIAFADETTLGSFYMANTELGGALNSFGEAKNWKGENFQASLKQAMVGYTIDEFIHKFNPEFPTHIKLDVDGLENKILRGAKQTLADERFQSVLVELDTQQQEYCDEVLGMMDDAGLKLHKKAHGPMFDEGEFSKVYNHIFKRD